MTQEEIKKILPHRGNMLLLDEVYKEDEVAHGKFLIRDDAWFLDGHFPGNPIVPGVIQCEILAQSICILLSDQMTEDKIAVYTGLNNVRFKSQVKPGDVFETKCRVTKHKGPFYFAEGEGYVDGRLCVKAEFSIAITEKQ